MKYLTKNRIYLSSFLSGFIFSMGLILSGMTNSKKVIGFLNIFRNWDFSLLFVMGCAVGIYALVNYLIQIKKEKGFKPLFAETWSFSAKKEVTKELVCGSIIFGIGWGMSGFCPGPAIVSLVQLTSPIVLFILMMLLGMSVFNFFFKK